MAKKGRRATEEERVRAARLMEEGKTAEVIADIMDVGRSTVFGWQQKYREGGLAALSTKFASGRPTVLSDQQMLQLYSMVVGRNPRQFSLGFALWTRKLVAKLIYQQFAVELSLPTVGRILKKLGMSPQRPLRRAYQQDPERVRQWKQQTYPEIRARAAEVGAKIFFADEAGVRTDYHAGTTWAPVGQTPVVAATGQRVSVNMISAVSPGGQLHFQVFEGSTNADRFIEYCQALLADTDRTVFLIVDGHSAHKAKKVQEFVASTEGQLELHFLPPYSPELNPDEWVWKNVKHDNVGRAVPLSKDELHGIVVAALQRLAQLPELVRGFFADPDLAYISR